MPRTRLILRKIEVFLRVKAAPVFAPATSAFVDGRQSWARRPWRPERKIAQTFAAGVWWASCGAFLAATVVYFLQFLEPGTSTFVIDPEKYPMLDDYKKYAAVKVAEKRYFVLFYAFGLLLAYMAARQNWLERVPTPIFFIVALIFVPPFHLFVGTVVRQSDYVVGTALLALLILMIPIAAYASHSLNSKIFGHILEKFRSKYPAPEHPGPTYTERRIGWEIQRADIYAAFALFLLIFPAPIQRIASMVAHSTHAVSFMVGPSLYGLADGLVPGRDFLAFYGHGPSYLLRFFLDSDLNVVFTNYVLFVSSLLIFFSLSAYFVLRDFFQERAVPFLITVILIILCQYGGDAAFGGPSALPIRYVFVFVSAAFACRLLLKPKGIHLITCGFIIGLSIFWNTETGIYTLVAINIAYVAVALARATIPWHVLILLLSSGISFLMLCILAFGFEVLSRDFFLSLVEPLTLHSASNWVGVIMNWRPGWGYFYQTMTPIIAIATAAAVTAQWTKLNDDDARKVRAYLLYFSLLALTFTAKWTNRSLDAVWHQNAFALLIVFAWWARLAMRWASERMSSKESIASMALVAIVGIFVSLWFWQDRHQPEIRVGLRAYLKYNSVASMRWLRSKDRPPVRVALAQDDVNLVDRYLDAGKPMLLMSDQDWLILLSLGRAPKSYFVPFRDSYSPDHVARSFEGTDLVFIDKDAGFSYDWLEENVRRRMDRDFLLVDRSERFILYKRKQ